MVKEGDRAPDFTLQADDGRMVSLKDYQSKKVVLYFYPKDDTPGCTREAAEFRDAVKELENENAAIVGVSKDSVESHKKFKEKYGLPFTLLSDPEGKVLRLYDVGENFLKYAQRTTFLIDEKGTVKKVYRKVNVEGHAKACLMDLKS